MAIEVSAGDVQNDDERFSTLCFNLCPLIHA